MENLRMIESDLTDGSKVYAVRFEAKHEDNKSHTVTIHCVSEISADGLMLELERCGSYAETESFNMPNRPSDKLTFTGYTFVEGVNVEVTLTVDTVAMIHELGRKAASSGNYSKVASSGYGSTAASSGYGSAAFVAGDRGSAKAGEDGCIALLYYDGKRNRVAVGYVGEDGIKADTWYVVASGKLIEASSTLEE